MYPVLANQKTDNQKVWRGFSALAFQMEEVIPTPVLAIGDDKEMSAQPVRFVRNPNRQNNRDYLMSLDHDDEDNTIFQGKGVSSDDFPKMRYLPALGE